MSSRATQRGDSDSASLSAALLHSAQLTLLLRRARSEELGFCRIRCLSRLLQTAQYLEKSLEWLDSEAETELALGLYFADEDGITEGDVQ